MNGLCKVPELLARVPCHGEADGSAFADEVSASCSYDDFDFEGR